ncbi:MAG: hypothetical protein ACPLRW_05575 [Moorellales bacterium]
MSSISRVLERHGDKIAAGLLKAAGSPLVRDVELENGIYEIRVFYVLADGTRLEGRPLDIDDLAQEYPDCGIGY